MSDDSPLRIALRRMQTIDRLTDLALRQMVVRVRSIGGGRELLLEATWLGMFVRAGMSHYALAKAFEPGYVLTYHVERMAMALVHRLREDLT